MLHCTANILVVISRSCLFSYQRFWSNSWQAGSHYNTLVPIRIIQNCIFVISHCKYLQCTWENECKIDSPKYKIPEALFHEIWKSLEIIVDVDKDGKITKKQNPKMSCSLFLPTNFTQDNGVNSLFKSQPNQRFTMIFAFLFSDL